MSKIVEAHRYNQNIKYNPVMSNESHKRSQLHEEYESGPPGTAQSKSGFSRSIDVSAQRPFT